MQRIIKLPVVESPYTNARLPPTHESGYETYVPLSCQNTRLLLSCAVSLPYSVTFLACLHLCCQKQELLLVWCLSNHSGLQVAALLRLGVQQDSSDTNCLGATYNCSYTLTLSSSLNHLCGMEISMNILYQYDNDGDKVFKPATIRNPVVLSMFINPPPWYTLKKQEYDVMFSDKSTLFTTRPDPLYEYLWGRALLTNI